MRKKDNRITSLNASILENQAAGPFDFGGMDLSGFVLFSCLFVYFRGCSF